MIDLWTVPREWAGETAFIIGGGPSLTGFDFNSIYGLGPVIAVNNAGFRAPWADVLYWSDMRWFAWNSRRLGGFGCSGEFKGKYMVTRMPPRGADETGLIDLKYLQYRPRSLSHSPQALGGLCSGSSAINLAYLFGAKTIVLLGFDMHGANFHDEHQLPAVENAHEERFIPVINAMAPALAAAGVTVLNATPGSSLKCFPSVKIVVDNHPHFAYV